MKLEFNILSLMWIIGIAAMVIIIPKNQLRKALFALLTCKALLWLSALIHVRLKLLAYPLVEFPKAIDVLFTTDYFFYPMIYSLYTILEPKLGFVGRLCYAALWVSGVTLIEYLVEKYTELITYENYAWNWAWINFLVIFFLSNLIIKWFNKGKLLSHVDRWATR